MNALPHDRESLSALVAELPREDWKYTDLSRAVDTGIRWIDSNDDESSVPHGLIGETTSMLDATWLVFANGRLLDTGANPCNGLTIAALDGDRADVSALPLAKLNADLLVDGRRLIVDADLSREKPIAILIADSAATGPVFASTRVDILVEEGCCARFVEVHVSEGEQDLWSNVVINVDAKRNASVEWQRLQTRGANHDQTNQLCVTLAADAGFRHSGIDLGGRLTRNDLRIDILEAGADAAFDGLYVSGTGQHIDNHTRVDHRAGPATSRQEYRGILDGRSRAVWNGKAIVHEGADGTDAEQANHNLLLSDGAEIDAKPELEIYADEVRCAHGTTVGQLDERALFYLRSRGLEREYAERILTRAFARSIVEKTPITELQAVLGDRVEDRLRAITRGEQQ